MSNSRKFIQLAQEDNVLVACAPLQQGEPISFAGEDFAAMDSIELGHKLAARAIKAGESILKLNVVIGSASRDIQQGEHVHLHNMQSDFIPTYTIEQ